MKRKSGFTLLELLIVITIIMILMALLVVLITNLLDRAKYSKTNAFVQALKSSCENYKTDFGGYPPVSLHGDGSSKNLHWHLGILRYVSQGGSSSNPGGGGIAKKEPGYIDFKQDQLVGSPSNTYPASGNVFDCADAWGNAIKYNNPNPGIAAPSFLILSTGSDLGDPDDDTRSDKKDN